MVTLADPATFTMSIFNRGTSPSRHVGLKVPVGKSARLVSAVPSTGRCGGVRAVFCWLGTLAPGHRVTVRVAVVGGAPGTLTIKSTASSETPDPDPGDNYASAPATVIDPFAGVGLRPQRVRVRRGVIRIRHACPPGTPRFCKGAVRVARAARGASGAAETPRARGPRFGEATFHLQPGAASRVPIRLSERARRLLKRRGRVRAVVIASAVDGAKTRRVTRARLLLVERRRKHGR